MSRIVGMLPAVLVVAVIGAATPGAGEDQGYDSRAGRPVASGPALSAPLQAVKRSAQSCANPPSYDGNAVPPRELPSAEASPLSDHARRENRSEQLELIAREADRKTRHGFELAGRGAFFAARAEFLGALRIMAASLDTEHQTAAHSRALTAALTAMKEAEDFLPEGARLERELDLPRVISTHATPVLKSGADAVGSLTAMKCYLTFAQEQFAAAVGREIAGAMALHALGKLYDAMAAKQGIADPAAAPKAMVYYQAALLVYPENDMAANDLGVLLTRSGRLAAARRMLEYSISVRQRSVSMRNLAKICRRQGEVVRADSLEREAAIVERNEIARRNTMQLAGNASVRWVDPETFARAAKGAPNTLPPSEPRSMQAEGQPIASAEDGIKTASRGVRSPAPTPAAAQRMAWEKSHTY